MAKDPREWKYTEPAKGETPREAVQALLADVYDSDFSMMGSEEFDGWRAEWLARYDAAGGAAASGELRSYAFHRPYCSPERGTVLARSDAEALWLVNNAYGAAGDTTVRSYAAAEQ